MFIEMLLALSQGGGRSPLERKVKALVAMMRKRPDLFKLFAFLLACTGSMAVLAALWSETATYVTAFDELLDMLLGDDSHGLHYCFEPLAEALLGCQLAHTDVRVVVDAFKAYLETSASVRELKTDTVVAKRFSEWPEALRKLENYQNVAAGSSQNCLRTNMDTIEDDRRVLAQSMLEVRFAGSGYRQSRTLSLEELSPPRAD